MLIYLYKLTNRFILFFKFLGGMHSLTESSVGFLYFPNVLYVVTRDFLFTERWFMVDRSHIRWKNDSICPNRYSWVTNMIFSSFFFLSFPLDDISIVFCRCNLLSSSVAPSSRHRIIKPFLAGRIGRRNGTRSRDIHVARCTTLWRSIPRTPSHSIVRAVTNRDDPHDVDRYPYPSHVSYEQ